MIGHAVMMSYWASLLSAVPVMSLDGVFTPWKFIYKSRLVPSPGIPPFQTDLFKNNCGSVWQTLRPDRHCGTQSLGHCGWQNIGIRGWRLNLKERRLACQPSLAAFGKANYYIISKGQVGKNLMFWGNSSYFSHKLGDPSSSEYSDQTPASTGHLDCSFLKELEVQNPLRLDSWSS